MISAILVVAAVVLAVYGAIAFSLTGAFIEAKDRGAAELTAMIGVASLAVVVGLICVLYMVNR